MDPSSPDTTEVRPRSTHRKQRAKGAGPLQREPSQDRSRRRREAILDATERLLETADIENLSLSDIGEMAQMSKASVHYHFPTVATIQLELSRRFDREVWERLRDFHSNLRNMRVPTWQEWVRVEAGVARAYFNSHRPACETILGPMLHRQNRLTMMQDNERLGHSKLRHLTKIFEVTNEAQLAEVLPYHGEILDVFWSGSYLKFGHINDHAFEESLRASVGYLRNFLPEILPMRVDGAERDPPAHDG